MLPRLLNLLPWRRQRLEDDLARELRDHLERRVADLLDAGWSHGDARRQAALDLGGVAQVQEAVRDTWVWRSLDDRARDFQYALRTLKRVPGFTAAALLSLALGVGGSTALFSLVDRVLLRPLSISDPDRLVHLVWTDQVASSTWGSGHVMSYPLCRDLEQHRAVFTAVFCRHPSTAHLAIGTEQEPVRVEIVTGGYFAGLGGRAEQGRLLDESDDRHPGAHPVLVLSHRFWQTRFGGAPDVVGRRVLLDGYPMTVIGVAAADVTGVDPHAPPAVWIPAAMAEHAAHIDAYWNRLLDRRAAWLHAFARLEPGVTAEAAQLALHPWFTALLDEELRGGGLPPLTAEQRARFLASTLEVRPSPQGLSVTRGTLERPLWLLMGGTLLLLALATLNVAGLLLARNAARSRELTTRMALGATRARIASQLLVESLLIALLGGLGGLALAPALSAVLLSVLSADPGIGLRLDVRVFTFAFLVSGVTGLLCGLAPALKTRRIPLIASLNERARLGSANGVRLRKAMVAGQLAFTLLLLVGAGLFLQTLRALQEQVGFDGRRLLMVSLDPPSRGYAEPDAERLMRAVGDTLRTLSTVERASIANTTLLSGGASMSAVTIQAEARVVSDRAVSRMRVGPGFFATLGTALIAGRDFDEADMRPAGGAPRRSRVAIVNDTFAQRYFAHRSPVGARIGLGNRPDTRTDIEIIGVVSDFSRRTLRDGALEQIFVPFWDQDSGDGAFYLRVRGDVDTAAGAVRAAVAELDPALPVTLTTFEDQVRRSLRIERMIAMLATTFGVAALLLAVVGLFGVMSFVVIQRTQEIGVRMALGATRAGALWLIVREASVMVAAGIALALPAAWALRRLVESQLYGISGFDAPTIAVATAVLSVVVLGAAMLPAWRAASIDPTQALRV